MAQNQYPLSATNERDIPLDVLEPRGYVKQPFNAATPLGGMLTGFDKEEVLLYLVATQDVIVSFSADGVTPNANQSFYALANIPYVLSIQDDFIDLTGGGTGGDAIMNFITKYDTFASAQQLGGES